MIKINVNGNRSAGVGYVSYYSCEEIANLLGIDQDEIIYETNVVDYFSHGDITFETEVIVNVTIADTHFDHIQELTNILVKYVGFFTNKCKVYYDVIDSRLIYLYEKKGAKKGCGCGHNHEEHSCNCDHDRDHECDCCNGDECTCGDDCQCHEKHHKCHCHEEE